VEAGRWRAASKTLQEIQQFLESGDGARLSQREQHELLAALTSGFFKTGRYVDGWKFAQQLVERTEVFYGGGVEQQWQYRLPWLRTALRLKRADAVVAWLNAQPVGPLAGVDPAYEIEWQTTVARVHAGLGDAERSRRAIARARALLLTLPKEDPVGWPVFVDLAEAGAALALNDPARAARVLHEAVQAPATPARLQPLIDELAAVAAYRAGRPEEAERLLGRAFAARRAQSDLPHPDELVIRINMALLSLRPGAPASDLKGLSALLSEAAPILASAYGDLHPLAQLTSRLHEVLASPEARPSSAVMAYLQSVTGSYLDQLVL
jgi:hypothetical protein